MSITLTQAQAQLNALLEVQTGSMQSVSIGGRSYSMRSLSELTEAINYWQRVVSQLERQRDGVSRHGYATADFRSRQ